MKPFAAPNSSFRQAIILAAALALLASILTSTFATHWNIVTAIYLTAPILGGTYLLHFFHNTQAGVGRVLAVTAWLLFALLTWWLAPALPVYLLLHAGALWLIRSLFSYSGLLAALADALLSVFAAITFVWAFQRTGSVFLATWGFFLVQALWIKIPHRSGEKSAQAADSEHNDHFELARRQADAALRQLFTQ